MFFIQLAVQGSENILYKCLDFYGIQLIGLKSNVGISQCRDFAHSLYDTKKFVGAISETTTFNRKRYFKVCQFLDLFYLEVGLFLRRSKKTRTIYA